MVSSEKVAVITGGSDGIGLATAKLFVERGCKVVICGRNQKKLNDAKKNLVSIIATERKFLAVKCDVRKKADVQKFIITIKKKFGRINYLINNAGTAVYKPIEKTTEDDWDSIIDTNLKGVFLTTKYALPSMSKKGVIVNISSGAGKYGFANFTAYCASKFGVIGFTDSLADELKVKRRSEGTSMHSSEIKVYAVCPGGVNTKLYHSLWPGEDPKKLIQPEAVAKKIADLCFNRNRKTGSAVNIYSLRDMREYVLKKM